MNNFLTPAYPVELLIEKRKHLYRVGEEPDQQIFPGVTGYLQVINKPALVPWAKREALELVREELKRSLSDPSAPVFSEEWIDQVIKAGLARPDKIKDDAADLGTLVHKYIDQVIQRKIPTDLTPEMEPAVTAFINWWQDSDIQVVMGDTKVASRIYKYGGSLDALGRQDGEYVILDWKTSNGIYDEYALQVAAYAQAFYETYGIRCAKGYIVRFSKKLPVTFGVAQIADLEKSFDGFLAAQNLTNVLRSPLYVNEL